VEAELPRRIPPTHKEKGYTNDTKQNKETMKRDFLSLGCSN